jgi:fumarate hydratase class II
MPRIGYDEAARVARKAYEGRKTIRQVVEEEGLFSGEELDLLLDPWSMVGPIKKRKG